MRKIDRRWLIAAGASATGIVAIASKVSHYSSPTRHYKHTAVGLRFASHGSCVAIALQQVWHMCTDKQTSQQVRECPCRMNWTQ